MYKGFQARYMVRKHVPYIYHRYTIGNVLFYSTTEGCLKNHAAWYMYGTCMVYVRKTYTVPQTLCTSGFQQGDGIWVLV